MRHHLSTPTTCSLCAHDSLNVHVALMQWSVILAPLMTVACRLQIQSSHEWPLDSLCVRDVTSYVHDALTNDADDDDGVSACEMVNYSTGMMKMSMKHRLLCVRLYALNLLYLRALMVMCEFQLKLVLHSPAVAR